MFIIIIWINGVEKKGERESGGWEWGEGGGEVRPKRRLPVLNILVDEGRGRGR